MSILSLLLCFLLLIKPNTEVNIARYLISNIRLDIPKAYHYSEYEKRGEWPMINLGIHESAYITIDALLPNLDAVNEHNQHLFKELGWGRKIRIRLILDEMYLLDEIVNSYRDSGLMLQNNIKIEGLQSYKLKMTKTSKPYKDLFIDNVVESIELVGKCDFENSVTSPSCKFDRIYSNGMHLQYVYSRNQLKHWKDIDKKVLNLISSFCTEKNNCLTLK